MGEWYQLTRVCITYGHHRNATQQEQYLNHVYEGMSSLVRACPFALLSFISNPSQVDIGLTTKKEQPI